jgi:hypothetical protein
MSLYFQNNKKNNSSSSSSNNNKMTFENELQDIVVKLLLRVFLSLTF